MRKKVISVIVFLILMGFHSELYSQPIPENLSQYKASMITDAQLIKYIEQASKTGLSPEQIENELKNRGLPESELAILRVRIRNLSDVSGKPNDNKPILNNYDSTNPRSRRESIIIDTPVSPKQIEVSRVFGSDLFSSSNVTFEPNLRMATPLNYRLGPDDKLIIDISGVNDALQSLTVLPDGYIRLKYVGPVFVNGLTIEEAKARIINRLSRIYPSVSNGSSKVIVSLDAVRSIKVTIIGSAKRPGTYTVSSLASVFNVLYASGGPDNYGSFREIEIVRNNKVVQKVDVYNFLLNGFLNENIRLEDLDVIRIPAARVRVNVVGELKRNGIFEVLPGESLSKVINDFCGGFQRSAYKALIKSERITDKEKKLIDITKDQLDSFIPQDGDTYTIAKILDRFENAVTISGSVFRPGTYSLKESMTVRNLIELADGFTEDAFKSKAILNRLKEDKSKEILFLDLSKILSDESGNIKLRKDDELIIKSIFDFQDEFNVEVNGAVRKPGTYPYVDTMRVKDLIYMAGGLIEDAYTGRALITKTRADGTLKTISFSLDSVFNNTAPNFILEKRDILTVTTNSTFTFKYPINIYGEVKNPGTYDFSDSLTLKSLILKAGGFTEKSSFNVEIARKRKFVDPNDPKASLAEIFKFTLDSSHLAINTIDFKIEAYDIVTVFPDPYRKTQEVITISGMVLQPGNYAIENRDERISSLIKRAGGVLSEANIYGARLKRVKPAGFADRVQVDKISKLVKDSTGLLAMEAEKLEDEIAINLAAALNNPGGPEDFYVRHKDEIIIPERDEMVEVSGEVLFPLKMTYRAGRRLKYYVNSSGGFMNSAVKKNSFVIYPNGRAARTKKVMFFFRKYPKVKAGSKIFIPKSGPDYKPKKSATEVLAIASAVATLAYLIVFISQQVK